MNNQQKSAATLADLDQKIALIEAKIASVRRGSDASGPRVPAQSKRKKARLRARAGRKSNRA